MQNISFLIADWRSHNSPCTHPSNLHNSAATDSVGTRSSRTMFLVERAIEAETAARMAMVRQKLISQKSILIFDHWVTVKGKRVSSKEAPILIGAPHSSFFDALVVLTSGPGTVVGKVEAAEIPFYGSEWAIDNNSAINFIF
jgi:hypothetical protein